jgi:hypothetical protein
MNEVLMRVGRLLDREKEGARGRFALGAQDSSTLVSPNPMHALIRWRPHPPDDEEDGGTPVFENGGCLEITAYGKTKQHATWFVCKKSVERFLDVLSAQVKPDTSPATFAELVAALIPMQNVDHDVMVTIVGDVWRNGRRTAAEAITPVFLADHMDPVTTATHVGEDGWLRLLMRSTTYGLVVEERDLFVLWHLPPDAEAYLTMVIARPFVGFLEHPIDPMSQEYVPPWSRLIADGASTCRLLYRSPGHIHFPRRVNYGNGVTCVEYMPLSARRCDVSVAKALARLFKQDADPIVVGLGYHALRRLEAFRGVMQENAGYSPPISTDHAWHVVWPVWYKQHFKNKTRGFFKRLIEVVYPTHVVGCREVSSKRGVKRNELFRWEDIDDDSDPVGVYECAAGPEQILFKIVPTSMRDASDADTDEGLGSEPDQELDWEPPPFDGDQ